MLILLIRFSAILVIVIGHSCLLAGERITSVAILPKTQSVCYALKNGEVRIQSWNDLSLGPSAVSRGTEAADAISVNQDGDGVWIIRNHRGTTNSVSHLSQGSNLTVATIKARHDMAVVDRHTVVGVHYSNPHGSYLKGGQLFCRGDTGNFEITNWNVLASEEKIGGLIAGPKDCLFVYSYRDESSASNQPTTSVTACRVSAVNVRRQLVVGQCDCKLLTNHRIQFAYDASSRTLMIANSMAFQFFDVSMMGGQVVLTDRGDFRLGYAVECVASSPNAEYLAVAGERLVIIHAESQSVREVWHAAKAGAPRPGREAFVVVWGDGRMGWIKPSDTNFFDLRSLPVR